MQRIVFFNTGWMKHYLGSSANDPIWGGGSFVNQHGYGHEVYHFLPYQGQLYGYVRTPKRAPLNVSRITDGAESDSADNVLVVWTAPRPNVGGTFVVGWYRNATVFRDAQPHIDPKRRDKQGVFSFYARAREADGLLLAEDARVCQIPRATAKSGGIGQSLVWYADSKKDEHIRRTVLDFIGANETGKAVAPARTKKGAAHQCDPFLRARIEKAAIKFACQHYTKLGYACESVERENFGWDVRADRGELHLRLEVKGLRDASPNVGLTPNEYRAMREYHDSYRLCIVTSALSDAPTLTVVSWSHEKGSFTDECGTPAMITEITAANVSIN